MRFMDWCPRVKLETQLNLFSASPMHARYHCENTGILPKKYAIPEKVSSDQHGKSQNTNNK